MKEIDDLMERHATEGFPSSWFPSFVLAIVRPETVDEVMTALPHDVREIVIAWAQEVFASGHTFLRFSQQAHWPDREAAIRDWVQHRGRLHWPRRNDEPNLDEIRARLGEPESAVDALRRDPSRILRYIKPAIVDRVMAKQDGDIRAAIIAWARETFAPGKELPTPRPWRARRGAEAALTEWLRRHDLREPQQSRVDAATSQFRAFRGEVEPSRGESGWIPAWSSARLEQAVAELVQRESGGVTDVLLGLWNALGETSADLSPEIAHFIKDVVVLCFTRHRASYDAADLSWIARSLQAGATAAQAYLALLGLPASLAPASADAIRAALKGTPYEREAQQL